MNCVKLIHFKPDWRCIFDTIKAYLSILDNKMPEKAFTTLKGACTELSVSYNSAKHGTRIWRDDTTIKEIREIEIIKQKRK